MPETPKATLAIGISQHVANSMLLMWAKERLSTLPSLMNKNVGSCRHKNQRFGKFIRFNTQFEPKAMYTCTMKFIKAKMIVPRSLYKVNPASPCK